MFLRGKKFSFKILRKKKCKKNHKICVKHEEKHAKEVKMHIFLVFACKSQDFVQSQNLFALSHNRKTVRFRNTVIHTKVL